MEGGVVEEMRRIQHRGFGSQAEKVQRDASFSTLNSEDISYFKGVLGEKNVVEDEERLEIANTDWMHKYRGSSKLLLQPRTTEEVEFFNSQKHGLLLYKVHCEIKGFFVLLAGLGDT